MGRTPIIPKKVLGSRSDVYSVPHSADLEFVHPDTENGNQFTASGNNLILVLNPSTDPGTVTILSSSDSFGRLGDIQYTLESEQHGIFGPFSFQGWVQPDHQIYLTANHGDLLIAVLDLS